VLFRSLFDGDLLEQNLEYVRSRYLATGKPVINYVLGMYGHTPFARDEVRQPDVLETRINGKSVPAIGRIANQFYYRTKAVYDFIMQLREIDPDAIVLVIADHIPAVLDRDVVYTMTETENIFVLFDGATRFQPEKHPCYYELPYAIMGMLAGRPVPVPGEGALEDLYFDILATGSGAGR
jgi:hypothetical protein